MLKTQKQQLLYPDVTVQLTNVDGNAFAVIGVCRQTAKQHGLSQEDIICLQHACAGSPLSS